MLWMAHDIGVRPTGIGLFEICPVDVMLIFEVRISLNRIITDL